MKKEQTLLVVCAGITALVAWSASGLYEPVQAAQIPNGSKVEGRTKTSHKS